MLKLKINNYLFPAVTFIVGILLATSIQFIYAHGGDTSLIHACIKSNNGSVRIIGANDTCGNGETSLDWSIQGPPGPAGPPGGGNFGLPFMCYSCTLWPHADKFAGKDFSNAQIINSLFNNANLQGVIFKGGALHFTTFVNADLTNADLSDLRPSSFNHFGSSVIDFPGANLTNANFSNDELDGVNFINAVLHNTNFTNAKFINADLTNATMMSTANLTGVTWSHTTCPDGTNSDNNGNTCIGHF